MLVSHISSIQRSLFTILLGYKLREKIGKALRACSTAIKAALKQYNDAAALLRPPRPPLTWSTVLNAATIADFDLLRDTRTDIRRLPWTEPARREATNYYFRIERAKEELVRLNVEITRLLTFMFDVHVDFYHAIQSNLFINPPLAFSLSSEWQYLDRIHESIVTRLVQTSRLPGFTGNLSIGTRLDRDKTLADGIPPPHWVSLLKLDGMVVEEAGDVIVGEGGNQDDDDVPRELGGVDTDLVVQLLENLNSTDTL